MIKYIPRWIRKKWQWIGMYVSFLIAGVFAAFFPTQVILDATAEASAYVWAAFVCFGSALCLYGILADKWTGEVVGIPALSAAMAILGVALVGAAQSGASIAFGWVFVGFSFGLIARWREQMKVGRISRTSRESD
jgi:MFS family permease